MLLGQLGMIEGEIKPSSDCLVLSPEGRKEEDLSR
jgi:hypothetical protein